MKYEEAKVKCRKMGVHPDSFSRQVKSVVAYHPSRDDAATAIYWSTTLVYNQAVEDCQRAVEESCAEWDIHQETAAIHNSTLESLKK